MIGLSLEPTEPTEQPQFPTEETRRNKLKEYLFMYRDITRDSVEETLLKDFHVLWPQNRDKGYQ